MKRLHLLSVFTFLLLPVIAWAAAELDPQTKTATVFIANYDEAGNFTGWGSGFFVDEGIVVTNKHVIAGGDWYRVYATNTNDEADLECKKNITKSDVKINLDDDVAYIRVYLPCEHGIMRFAEEDPVTGDPVWVIGYPYKASFAQTLTLTTSTGTVTGTTEDGWLKTSAPLDRGSSGGPVVNGSEVLGVAVAKGVDADGNYITGYFIPSSVILRGLLYANDPRFGYTQQAQASSRIRSSSMSSSSSSRLAHVFSSLSASSRSANSSAQRSAYRSSVAPVFSDISPFMLGYAAIISLRDRNIISGYSDGTYRPDNGINRAEFMKLLVAGFRPQDLRGEVRCFSDVRYEWYAQYVCAAKRLGWIGGYPDGTFRPAQEVNRAEAMKIIIEAFGNSAKESEEVPSDVRRGAWFYSYVAAGVNIGIVDSAKLFHPGDILTREVAAIWIYTAAKFSTLMPT